MKSVLIIIIFFLLMGCSSNPGTSYEFSGQISEVNISSAVFSASSKISEPSESDIDYYMECFKEGKYNIYDLKIGDSIEKALNEFGTGEKKYYGLGAHCYVYGDLIIAFVEGTEPYENRVTCFDIIGNNITVYGLTTGSSTIEDVKKIFGEPEGEWCTGYYSYENYKLSEEAYDEGDQYFFLQYSNNNEDFQCHINFFFEYGILKVISMGSTTGF